MYSLSTVAALATFFSTTLAIAAPPVPGFNPPTWSENFAGPTVDLTKWAYWPGAPSNGEQEIYPTSGANCHITSSNTLQILPDNSGGQWTSCRIESHEVFAANATAGLKMLVQARFKIGQPGVTAAQLQGIWPAFWSLGAGVRDGVAWPGCGEIDTFENVDGATLGFGTLHCGGACNDTPNYQGISSGERFDFGTFHTWAHEVDVTSTDWTKQSITFSLDGTAYRTILGSDVGNQAAWTALVGPMFLTLNVAVGGQWPGSASASTATGITAGMEVQYVAVYHSN
ncbi:glycoside hydrolase family 16 protein [Stipitochalara longipes BDJ]|nr:glycoside hydrolase family 16 protein [Stipitochalara longipes BDJ]